MPETFTLIIWDVPGRSEIERHERLGLDRVRELAEEILAQWAESPDRITWDKPRRAAKIVDYYGEPLDFVAVIHDREI